MTAINAKIASMTVRPTPGLSSQTYFGSIITSNSHVISESHEVLAEQAQVALVKLHSILKPASKKEKKNP